MIPSKIIEEGDNILLSIKDLDQRMYKKLSKFLAQNTLDGNVNISNEDLAVIEDIVYQEIVDSDYEEKIAKYLSLLTAIEGSISKQQQELNRIKASEIKSLWNNSDYKAKLVNKIVYDLGAGGLKDYFVKGVAQVVRDSNFFNLTIGDAMDQLSKVLVEDGYTQQYLQQTSRDALSQYAGAINDEVRVRYELDNLIYIGNVIETSRPFCTHLRDDFKGKLTSDQLKQALQEYCPNGVPSQSKITYQTTDGNKTARKGAGMIEGTRFDNFSQLKGGYGCRHEAVWVRKK